MNEKDGEAVNINEAAGGDLQMGSTFAGEEEQSRRRWIFAGFVKKGVGCALALSLVIFIVYMIGSMPDSGFSDSVLFLLLRLLQYASLLLCVFSLFAMGFSVHLLVHRPSIRNFLILCLYFFTGILGAGFAALNSMILAVAGGR